jgi:Zn-dependent M32 family carboxypeptidase
LAWGMITWVLEKLLRYIIWKRLFANELISIHVPSLWEKKVQKHDQMRVHDWKPRNAKQ